MFTLDLLPSIRDSETITCDHCHTRQFPRNGACVRCRRPLGLEYLVVPIESLLNCCSADCSEQLAHTIGSLLRSMRKRRHMCQCQLAARTGGVNRSRICRAECGHVLLPLTQLLTLARALGLTSVILRFDSRGSGAAVKPERTY
jgi:hypothetical protein